MQQPCLSVLTLIVNQLWYILTVPTIKHFAYTHFIKLVIRLNCPIKVVNYTINIANNNNKAILSNNPTRIVHKYKHTIRIHVYFR